VAKETLLLTEIYEKLDRLPALADFLPTLEAADFSAGKWIRPSDTADGVSRLPFRDPSEAASAFFDMVHAYGWVTRFDWPAWAGTQEAEALFAEDGMALAQANEEQLRKMLTVCVRRDRFSYGDPLLQDLESGLIERIARRADQLAREAV
jgi:hypothetical protein